MIRSFTILILTVAQVLSGLGCGGYLCLHRDGTLCCVDEGAESCDCCTDSAESSDVPCADEEQYKTEVQCQDECCSHQHDAKCCAVADSSNDTNLHRETHWNGFAALESLPCGCIHVPVGVPVARVDYGSAYLKVESCGNPFPHFDHSSPLRICASESSCIESHVPPSAPLSQLLQHSCIVMRC